MGNPIKERVKKCMVMPLNQNKSAPPLFFICGIALYSPLAKNLKFDFSCYGVYVPEEESFLSQGNKVDMTIPYLAELYVKAIKHHTPAGPYTIAGVSFGGILAFEISRQLQEDGNTDTKLIILDAVLPGSLKRGWGLSVKLACKKLKKLATIDTLKLAAKKIFSKRNKKITREDKKKQLWKIIRGKATKQYFANKPTFSGPTLIVRAKEQYGHTLVPDLCWSPMLKGDVILGEAPGSHLEIIQSQKTAELIYKYTPATAQPRQAI